NSLGSRDSGCSNSYTRAVTANSSVYSCVATEEGNIFRPSLSQPIASPRSTAISDCEKGCGVTTKTTMRYKPGLAKNSASKYSLKENLRRGSTSVDQRPGSFGVPSGLICSKRVT